MTSTSQTGIADTSAAAAAAPAAEAAAPPSFDAVLHPQRSLSPSGFLSLMLVLAGISFTAGIAFLSVGAWPVLGFFGLDVLLVYAAFRLNYRSGRAYQTVQLTPTELVVRDVDPRGRERSWRFEPTWLRVELEEPPGPRSPLALCSHGGTLVIGAFLTPEEKRDFAAALRQALRDWRAGLVRRPADPAAAGSSPGPKMSEMA